MLNTNSQTGILCKLRRLFAKPDPEVQRRAFLKEKGRIIEGVITDIRQNGHSINLAQAVPDVPCIIFYKYSTSSVTYESSQALRKAELLQEEKYRLGKLVSVRYDPRRPTNSFVE